MSQHGHSFQIHPLGSSFEDSEVTVFFGHSGSDQSALEKAFPEYHFSSLQQIHSNRVLTFPSDELDKKADGHITHQRRAALTIRTADCVPVLIHDRASGYVAALHAGWRGVESEIIKHTEEQISREKSGLKSARAWIGPHIGESSFEVGDDVAEKLLACFDSVRGYSDESTPLRDHAVSGKKFVSLITIVRAQLAAIGIERDRTQELLIDTFHSRIHDSFRRDGSRGGRQTSFIALK